MSNHEWITCPKCGKPFWVHWNRPCRCGYDWSKLAQVRLEIRNRRRAFDVATKEATQP